VADIDAIIQIESSGNTLEFNKATSATGLCQITPICLADYNQYHKHSYTMDEMFDPQKNMRVAEWYLSVRLPRLLECYRRPVTLENILIGYNAGVRHVIEGTLPDETRKYIAKYHRLTRRGG
jgi:soluble lytic murein transglycosylase-like protein